jgi:hypothetical protein
VALSFTVLICLTLFYAGCGSTPLNGTPETAKAASTTTLFYDRVDASSYSKWTGWSYGGPLATSWCLTYQYYTSPRGWQIGTGIGSGAKYGPFYDKSLTSTGTFTVPAHSTAKVNFMWRYRLRNGEGFSIYTVDPQSGSAIERIYKTLGSQNPSYSYWDPSDDTLYVNTSSTPKTFKLRFTLHSNNVQQSYPGMWIDQISVYKP